MGWLDGLHGLIGTKGGDITWWQMTARGVLVFLFGVVLVRVAGRRAFGRQTPLDIVLAVIIGSNLSRALTGNAPFFPTLAATAALVTLYWVIVHVAARSRLLGWLVKGDVVCLVRDGRPDLRAMRKAGISDGDLEEAAREAGTHGPGEVDRAVLERSGKISIARR